MRNKLLSLVMAIVLLCQVAPLPVIASSAPITISEMRINALESLAGLSENAPGWHVGMTPTNSMNAMQVEAWLDWFLINELRGAMKSTNDLLVFCRAEGNVPGKVSELENLLNAPDGLRHLEEVVSYHQETLEHQRFVIYNELSNMQDPTYTDLDKQQSLDRINRAEKLIKESIADVAANNGSLTASVDNTKNSLQSIRNEPGVARAVDNHSTALLAQARGIQTAEQQLAGAEFDILVLSTKQFGFLIRDRDGNAITDAKVKVTCAGKASISQEKTVDSNGVAIFLTADFHPDGNNEVAIGVAVSTPAGSAKPYRAREVLKTNIRGGEAQKIALDIDDGSPYLSMACYNGRDILSEKNTIFNTELNDKDQTFSIRVKGSASGKVSLVYTKDGKEKLVTNDYKGDAQLDFLGKWCSILPPGTVVTFRLAPDGAQTIDYVTQLNVEKAVVVEPLYKSDNLIRFTPHSFKFTIPGKIPFVGGSDVVLDIPGCNSQLAIDPSGYAMFAYGKTFDHEMLDWKSEDLKTRERKLDYANKETACEKAAALAGVLKNEATTRKAALLGACKATFTLFAGMEGRVSTKDERIGLKGDAGFVAAFKGGFTQTFTIGPVPFFAGVDFGLSLGVGVGVGFEADWPKLDNASIAFGSGVTVSIMIVVGATIGVGLKDIASVSLWGYGSINPTLSLSKTVTAAVKLGMGFTVTVQVLFLKWMATIWEGTWPNSSGTQAQYTVVENYTNTSTTPTVGLAQPSASTVNMAAGKIGVRPDSEKVVYDRIDLLVKDIQFIETRDHTYAFCIQPDMVKDKNGKKHARICWYCVDDPKVSGVIDNIDNDMDHYAMSVTLAQTLSSDRIGIATLAGKFGDQTDPDKPKIPSKSFMGVIVLSPDSGSLSIVYEKTFNRVSESNKFYALPSVQLGFYGGFLDSWDIRNTCVEMEGGIDGKANRALLGQVFVEYQGPEEIFLDDTIKDINITRIAGTAQKNTTMHGANMAFYAQNATDSLILRRLKKTYELSSGEIVYFKLREGIEYEGEIHEHVIYLVREKLKSGEICNRLKGFMVLNTLGYGDDVIKWRNYDVNVYADTFELATIMGDPYLYWTECSHPSDPNDPDQKASYLVRAVKIEEDKNLMSAPFTLLELSEMPIGIYLGDKEGYYAVDLSDGDPGNAKDNYTSVKLIKIEYKLQLALDILGASASDPVIGADTDADLLFSVKNTGNLPVSEFDVNIKMDGRTIQKLHVDCENPKDNTNSFYDFSTGGLIRTGGWTSVRRVDGIFDDMNGDVWRIVSKVNDGPEVYDEVQSVDLVPDGVHTYQAAMHIPEEWNGVYHLEAEIGNVSVRANWQDGLTGTNTIGGTQQTLTVNPNSVIVQIAPDGKNYDVTSGVAQLMAQPIYGRANMGGAEKRKFEPDHNDLMMDWRLSVVDGVETVHLNIINRAGANAAPRNAATVTIAAEGKTLFAHTFQHPIGESYGYSLDIPLDRITGGMKYDTLTATVSGGGAYKELASNDNSRILLLNNGVRFAMQPSDVTVMEGDGASFAVSVTGGNPPYRYRWQQKTPSGIWTDVVGATGETLTYAKTTLAQNGLLVRCVVTDMSGVSYSSAQATLTVIARAPLTGDGSPLRLWLFGTLASLMCLAALTLWRRRGLEKRGIM